MPCQDCPYTAAEKLIGGQTYKCRSPHTRLDAERGLLVLRCHNDTSKDCDGVPMLRQMRGVMVTTRQDKSNGMMEIEVEKLDGPASIDIKLLVEGP